MKIGLFFGSFNPIHVGHLMLANYFVEYTDLESLWFVVSPESPFKSEKDLLSGEERLRMVELALRGMQPIYQVSDIEFELPKPSYSAHTLRVLRERFPSYEFVLIMGADNIVGFSEWRNYEEILQKHQIYVYPRSGFTPEENSQNIRYTLVEAPQIEISASFIRNSIRKSKNMCFFMPAKVAAYVDKKKFYK